METLEILSEAEVMSIILSFLKARGDRCATEKEMVRLIEKVEEIRVMSELVQGAIDGHFLIMLEDGELAFGSLESRDHPNKHRRWERRQKSKGLCTKCPSPATSKTLCDYHRQKKREDNERQSNKKAEEEIIGNEIPTASFDEAVSALMAVPKKDHTKKELVVTKPPYGMTVDELRLS